MDRVVRVVLEAHVTWQEFASLVSPRSSTAWFRAPALYERVFSRKDAAKIRVAARSPRVLIPLVPHKTLGPEFALSRLTPRAALAMRMPAYDDGQKNSA
jgi:hypothetical protein